MILSAVLLAAGVAAAVAAGVTRIAGTSVAADGGPRIASVRLAELAAEHAEAARAGASADGIRASTRAWAAALERALGDIAGDRRVVLLLSRAVAAGAPDLTGLVRSMVEDRLKRTATGGEARP